MLASEIKIVCEIPLFYVKQILQVKKSIRHGKLQRTRFY